MGDAIAQRFDHSGPFDTEDGGQVGYGAAKVDFGRAASTMTDFMLRNAVLQSELHDWTLLGKNDIQTFGFGGFVGRNWQWDDVVLGLEVNYNHFTNFKTSAVNSMSRLITNPIGTSPPANHTYIYNVTLAGGAAVQFVKEYAAAGIKIPLCGAGFLTEGTLGAQGAAAEGIETALHYGDRLDNAKNTAFRKAFKDKAGSDADVYAVQGYDAAQLLAIGLEAAKGNVEDEANLYKAMRSAKIDSPRGAISISPAQNVTQNIYLRKAQGGQNKVIGIAAENLADPGTGCKLG